MKELGGGRAPLILDLDAGWRWVVNITPRKVPRQPLATRPGGSQNRFGRFGEEKKLKPLQGFERRIVQPVARSLLQLRYPGSIEQTNKYFRRQFYITFSVHFRLSVP